MDPTENFNEQRSLLFGIAYRMLGSVMEAEDMVQELYLRWMDVDHSQVESPRAFLTAMMTRRCIDELRSARRRRETYIGPWLPEPLVSAPGDLPDSSVMRLEAVSTAFLVLMEELTPEQRAAFVLHDVFGYGYADVAEVLNKGEASCRQLVSRARRRLQGAAAGPAPSLQEQLELARDFWTALQQGDAQGALATLADDVVWWSDGGGKAFAARRPITGAEEVLRFVQNIQRLAPPEATARWLVLNRQPGVVFYVGGQPASAITMDIRGGRIATFFAVVNPDKLRSLPGPPANPSFPA